MLNKKVTDDHADDPRGKREDLSDKGCKIQITADETDTEHQNEADERHKSLSCKKENGADCHQNDDEKAGINTVKHTLDVIKSLGEPGAAEKLSMDFFDVVGNESRHIYLFLSCDTDLLF